MTGTLFAFAENLLDIELLTVKNVVDLGTLFYHGNGVKIALIFDENFFFRTRKPTVKLICSRWIL